MQILRETWHLLQKEISLEWRQKYAISGILLYVISSTFVVYTAIGEKLQQMKVVWGALFWIVVVFASVNAITKSFVQENTERQLYYYTLAKPSAIILSKIIYNTLLLVVIISLAYGAFGIFLGNPIQHNTLFWSTILLGSLGFSITFTFISAISSKANQNATLMAILSFPIILPMLMLLLRLTKIALGAMHDSAYYQDILMLLSIDIILISLVFMLFPFLWRD
ncbi:MAG: heme exporter protein CcmB [Saprospiraceae bacterium]|nr:heme exporter protein CcmB [Saprospiraceae bacterium]